MNLKKLRWGVRALSYKLIFRKVGLPTYIGKPLYVSNFRQLVIGKRCRIFPNLRAETVGKNARIAIGNNVSIGQGLHVVSGGGVLKIGSNVTISGNVLITNCNHNYQQIDIHILDQALEVKHTEIGDGCFIGYGAVLQAGTVLGKQCIVGANSVVKGVFPDYSVIVGAPAYIVKRYDSESGEWRKVDANK